MNSTHRNIRQIPSISNYCPYVKILNKMLNQSPNNVIRSSLKKMYMDDYRA
jgi:hypothetical protein